MYEVNFGLLKPIDIGGEFQAGWKRGADMVKEGQAAGALQAYMQNPDDPRAFGALSMLDPATAYKMEQIRAARAKASAEARALALSSSFGQIAAREGPAAAGQAAVAAGMPEEGQHYYTAGKAGNEFQQKRLEAAGPMAWKAIKLPEDQRRAFVDANRDALRSGGWTDAEIDGVDLSNDFLSQVIRQSLGMKGVMDLEKKDYKVVPFGASLEPFNALGDYIGTNPEMQTIGATPAPASAPRPAAGAPGVVRFDVTPGAKPTSGYRTPAHNERVGGVANSYHTRLDAEGNPMGWDWTPPPGMSMSAFHADMKRRNPGADILNEGDHVHGEPPQGAVAYPGPERGNYYPTGKPINLDPNSVKPTEAEVRAEAAQAIADGIPAERVRAFALERYGVTI